MEMEKFPDKQYPKSNPLSRPTPLDALLYGHMKALLSANGPKAALMIKPITNALLRHFLRMSNITQMKLTVCLFVYLI